MKKLILVSMLLLGMLTFAERFTSPNKRLEISLKENAEGQSPAGYFWYNEEGEADRYSFFIVRDNKKGIYYVNNYVDLQGKKHTKLYFGFDKKHDTIVILDKNMNIVEVLQRGAAG